MLQPLRPYRIKPDPIEALQWTGQDLDGLGVACMGGKPVWASLRKPNGTFLMVYPGDWITYKGGIPSVLTDKDFRAIYEPC
jgi:hypothetical protein